MAAEPASAGPGVRARRGGLLVAACAAILLTAADTYVVVLALPDIMAGVGLSTAELTRATPVVSIFLLGYIAMLPLLGRLSDTRGRLPVLRWCMVVFCLGSLVTAAAPGLGGVVAGRFLQGLGGGGLVPVTLARVADTWPADRRGVPLGAVGAVQELGSVVGPLYGAALLAVGDWRLIFWANALLGAVVLVALAATRGGPAPSTAPLRDRVGAVLGVLAAGVLWVAWEPPSILADSVTWGGLVVPLAGGVALTSPVGLVGLALVVAFLVRQLTAAEPLVDLRHLPVAFRQVDGLGAVLLAGALGGVVLALASPDPETQTLNDGGVPLLIGAAVLAVAFVVRELHTTDPLVPLGALRRPGAWGSLLVSVLVGAALIAALVDVPLFARATAHPDSQLAAALVLLRFLVGLPVGALAGGWALRALSPRLLTAAGMAMAAVGLWLVAGWDATTLEGGVGAHDVHLLVAGLGIGLAVAPVNDAALRAVHDRLHGLASALVVVARNTGMLLGLSGLTAWGLTRFRSATAVLPSPAELCPGNPLDCPAYNDGLTAALLDQLSAIFAGAAACALAAAILAALLLSDRR